MENYEMNQGHELGWDDEIEQESSWILLPDGDYRFTVEKFDRARHAGSEKIPPCNKAIVFFRVFDGNGNSVLITENLFLHTSMEWKLSEFFASIGMKQKGEKARMNWNEVYSKSGICHVKIRNYKKKDGSDGQSNQIDKLYPTYDQPQISAPAQTAYTPPQTAYNAPQQSYTQNYAQQPQQPQTGAQGGWKPGNF